jgi:hypothetical protein
VLQLIVVRVAVGAKMKENRQLACDVSSLVLKRFWVPERHLLADDESHQHFSEHAQCLALLNGVLPRSDEPACFNALISTPELSRTTIYFSFYLLEVFQKFGRGDLLLQRLDFWKALVKEGFKTPVESPEPSRSDCHAWGSHPLFHERASLLGVRPSKPGFREIEIRPAPGGLRSLDFRVPHPRGWIEGRLDFDASGKRCAGSVTLPPGIPGLLKWKGKRLTLPPGTTTWVK